MGGCEVGVGGKGVVVAGGGVVAVGCSMVGVLAVADTAVIPSGSASLVQATNSKTSSKRTGAIGSCVELLRTRQNDSTGDTIPSGAFMSCLG